ncbi:retrovirus-related pol polyprotein from transposon TNT 1-94, partial [Tanacetum coccineum]
VRLKETVRRIRTDNGTEFVNQTLREYYEKVGISHKTSVARSPQQNGVVERRNRTLIKAVRTMLIYAKVPLFLWAEAVATTCYTQNRSMIRLCHGKTPYELLHNKPPDLSYLHVFGALCYPTNDSKNLGKLQPKADIGIFIGYAPTKKAFRIYNRRTRRIIETIHVDFNELTAMASEHSSSGPALHEMTHVQEFRTRAKSSSFNTICTTFEIELGFVVSTMFDESLNPPPYELVPPPDKAFVITLKWIYKVKLDELGASRPDLQFDICMCARYQDRHAEINLKAVKRIFRYLKGTVHQGLCYPKDSSFALTAFADTDHAGCHRYRRSTSGEYHFWVIRHVSGRPKRQKALAISV